MAEQNIYNAEFAAKQVVDAANEERFYFACTDLGGGEFFLSGSTPANDPKNIAKLSAVIAGIIRADNNLRHMVLCTLIEGFPEFNIALAGARLEVEARPIDKAGAAIKKN